MNTFDIEKFFVKNKRKAANMLLSFMDIEVREYMLDEIVYFLNHSSVGEKMELTDHFIIKESDFEVIILNETTEMFALNPEESRAHIEIVSLLFLINQKMSCGLNKVKSILKIN
ncbi:hypothetical protein [Paenibacillus sp. OK003]|uniref:hypothetical protein n=1 Tax=Paenibacillus sp. OK003 TaxID=1884380 RepID=UPI0008C451B0|nr:hypothetical protein [Paenibacillus sp. OK003]SEL85424.1 hypothetical protein SAMN05518856_12093 [Paenibacillus sp. OK003]